MIRAVVTASSTGNHPGFARTPSPFNTPIVHSGNSLTDITFQGSAFGLSGMVNAMAGSSVAANQRSTIVGSPMSVRWTDGPSAVTVDAKATIGIYKALVLTDVSTNFNTNSFSGTVEQLPTDCLNWVNLAWTQGDGGAGAETLLWCTWAPRDDPPDANAQYLTRIQRWSELQDYCNARRPQGQKPVRLIPGSWLWYEFWKDQQNGLTPTATWYTDLYDDNIHQYRTGAYISQLLHLCCIYGVDPLLAPATSAGVPALNTTELAYVRAKIKQVVRAVPRSGVDTSAWL